LAYAAQDQLSPTDVIGEEAFFDGSGRKGANDSRVIGIYGGTSAGGAVLGGAANLCGIVPGKQGSLVIPDFGFEYVTSSGETKQQVGKLAISCMDAC